MQVILMEKVGRLGNLGDQVNVKPGYGRNFLIPLGKSRCCDQKAISRNSSSVALKLLEAAAAERRAAADARAAQLAELVVTIGANAGDEGRLFGSIGTSRYR